MSLVVFVGVDGAGSGSRIKAMASNNCYLCNKKTNQGKT